MKINKKGFTLVEILVALFLTGLVMIALVGLWVSTVNFASSNKDEILYKNAFSTAARVIESDIKDSANIHMTSSTDKEFFLYKNFAIGINSARCLATGANKQAKIVSYCYDYNAKALYRSERQVGTCSGPSDDTVSSYSLSSACGASTAKMLIDNLQEPVFTRVSNNLFRIQFDGKIYIGKQQRPVTLVFDKTMHYAAIGSM